MTTNIEGKNVEFIIDDIVSCFDDNVSYHRGKLRTIINNQLQKARDEEREKVHRMVDNILAVSIDYHMDSVVLARDIENIAKKYFPTKDHSELDQPTDNL